MYFTNILHFSIKIAFIVVLRANNTKNIKKRK